MSHSRSSNSRICNFHSTSFTNDSLISNSFILSTTTFKIFNWSENGFTKQTTLFRSSSSIINSIWIFHYSMRSRFYIFYRCKSNQNSIKISLVHEELIMIKKNKSSSQKTNPQYLKNLPFPE